MTTRMTRQRLRRKAGTGLLCSIIVFCPLWITLVYAWVTR